MKYVVLVMVVMQLLTACATTKEQPRVNFYQLPSLSGTQAEGSVSLPPQRLSVVRVGTTEVLAQTGIVTASRDGRVITANYHHWSELPEFALQRSLNSCLRTQKVRRSGKISLDVDAFHSDGSGASQFAGVWYFASGTASTDQQYRFSYRQSLSRDGYTALVGALSKSIQQLCEDIGLQLR